MSKLCTLPARYRIRYKSVLSAARVEGSAKIMLSLQDTLSPLWCDAYLKAGTHQANLVRFRVGAFEYICDVYSDLEAKGEVAYDQTRQDRVVAAFGISGTTEPRNARGPLRWIDPNEHAAITERDHGHLIAQCIGGSGLGLNVFSQDRKLNRGHSAQGKTYRQMERYCQEQPGTFCFSRPIYVDGSSVPRWLEFGVLKQDQTLWIEVFEN